MKKYFIAMATLAFAFMLGACSNNEDGVDIAITNGDEAFITSDLKEVTKQEVFEMMVSGNGNNGILSLLELVDYDVLSPLFEIDQEAIEGRIETFRTLTDDFDAFLASEGFDSEEDLHRYLEVLALREEAVLATITITEEELQAAYDEIVSTMTEEDVTEEDAVAEDEDVTEEDAQEIPTFEEVRDDLEQTLIASKATQDVAETELARLREDAGFVILNTYLQQQYVDFLTGQGVNVDEVITTSSKTDKTNVATIDGVEYTADQLFEVLLPAHGLSTGISLVDLPILMDRFEVDEAAITDILDQFKIQLGEQYYPFMISNGLNGDEEIFNHFKLLQLQETAFTTEYVITEERLKELYEDYGTDQVSARHILVEDEELAKEIIAQLEASDDVEATFIELAAQHGTDGTATSGGDLGSFGSGQMVEPFEEAAFALEVNAFTAEPVETEFGFHVIYRYETVTPSFEELREELENTELQALFSGARLEAILIRFREEDNFRFTNENLQARYESVSANILASLEETEASE